MPLEKPLYTASQDRLTTHRRAITMEGHYMTLRQSMMPSIIAAIQEIPMPTHAGQSTARKRIPDGEKREQGFTVLICSIQR